MNFAQAISSGFSKYVQFGGRACRSEYWYWTLFVVIASIAANIVDATLGSGTLTLNKGTLNFGSLAIASGGQLVLRGGATYSDSSPVTTAGTAHCWGSSSSGKLGDGNVGGGSTPVTVVDP